MCVDLQAYLHVTIDHLSLSDYRWITDLDKQV